ncbi:hypothetical protein ACFLSJ_06685 [Verrucomicrobiota bacterium]
MTAEATTGRGAPMEAAAMDPDGAAAMLVDALGGCLEDLIAPQREDEEAGEE